jgi:hypothetical protein
LINRKQHSSVSEARFFREADGDTDCNLVVEEDRERLAVSKRKMKIGYGVAQSQGKVDEGKRDERKAYIGREINQNWQLL